MNHSQVKFPAYSMMNKRLLLYLCCVYLCLSIQYLLDTQSVCSLYISHQEILGYNLYTDIYQGVTKILE